MLKKEKRLLGKWMLCLPLLLLLIGAPRFLIDRPFYVNMLIMIFLYIALAQGWNLVAGYSGQLNFANHTFFAIGAYTSSVLLIYKNVSPWLGLWVGIIFAAFIAFLLGIALLRLRGHYFAVATIAFAEVMRTVFINWDFVGGAYGLRLPLKMPSLYYCMWPSKTPYYYIFLGFALFTTLLIWIIDHSKAGVYLKAIKQDQLAAEHKGINTTYYKVLAFCINAGLCAALGTFFAQYILYISPDSIMVLLITVQIIVIALFGGLGAVFGPVVGATLLVPLGELTRVKLGGGGSGYDYLLYGLIILALILYEPRGMIGLMRRWRSYARRVIKG